MPYPTRRSCGRAWRYGRERGQSSGSTPLGEKSSSVLLHVQGRLEASAHKSQPPTFHEFGWYPKQTTMQARLCRTPPSHDAVQSDHDVQSPHLGEGGWRLCLGRKRDEIELNSHNGTPAPTTEILATSPTKSITTDKTAVRLDSAFSTTPRPRRRRRRRRRHHDAFCSRAAWCVVEMSL